MNQTPLDTPMCLPRTQAQGVLLPIQHIHMSTSLIRTTAPTVLPKTQANRIDLSHCWDTGAARGLVFIAELLGKPRTAARGAGCRS